MVIADNTFTQQQPRTGFCGAFGAANGIHLVRNRFTGLYGGLGADSNCRRRNLVPGNTFSALAVTYEGTWVRGGWTFSGNVGLVPPTVVQG